MFQLPEPAAVSDALGRSEQKGRVTPEQGAPSSPSPARSVLAPASPQRRARRGRGTRACCAHGAGPSPRRRSTGRSPGTRCTCSGSPPRAHCTRHRSRRGAPGRGAPPEHTGGGGPADTPSSLQVGPHTNRSSRLGGFQSAGPWPCPPDLESVHNPAVQVTATRGPKKLPGGSQSLCLVQYMGPRQVRSGRELCLHCWGPAPR